MKLRLDYRRSRESGVALAGLAGLICGNGSWRGVTALHQVAPSFVVRAPNQWRWPELLQRLGCAESLLQLGRGIQANASAKHQHMRVVTIPG